MKTYEISRYFCDFYRSKGYIFLPKASLLHPSVPMSFVMSAGLVQVETALNANTDLVSNKFSLIQKCFRYFDIQNVGNGISHLSLFEMPGAFSFTTNGKNSAIHNMWEVLTSVLCVNKSNLWVTFFAGGSVSGRDVKADEKTAEAWYKIGLPQERIIGLGPSHNFWKQGKGFKGDERFRKCGSNTEIFFDQGEELKCGSNCKPGCRCGRFLEIANSLFIGKQIDDLRNRLYNLHNPFTETVVGSERIAMILQRKTSVFDIDVLFPIIEFIREKQQPSVQRTNKRRSENIVADHLRALVYLVADGAPPAGKNGRQRLVKILIRETLTHAFLIGFGIVNHLDELIDVVIGFSDISNKSKNTKSRTVSYFMSEEGRFSVVQKRGRRKLQDYIRMNKGRTLSGTQIVDLEKKFGFPSELTDHYISELGLSFKEGEYLTALKTWRNNLIKN